MQDVLCGKDAAQRSPALQNEFSSTWRKLVKINLDGSKLHRLLAMVQQKYLPRKYVPLMVTLQNLKMDGLPVKPLQGWSHVVTMNKETPVGFRYLFALDPFNGWQR
jgi:hypothetical protein